jgi:hypothetical protein
MKKGKYFVICVILMILQSCGDATNLTKDYYYLSNDNAKDVGLSFGSVIYKSSNEKSLEEILIISDILSVEVKKDFIIAIQYPNIQNFKNELELHLSTTNSITTFPNYFRNLNIDEKEFVKECFSQLNTKINDSNKSAKMTVDSLFNYSNNISHYFKQKHYFIIDTQKDILSKPMNMSTFQKECQLRDIDYKDFIK